MGLMIVDWIMYAGFLAIWVLIWAGYYLWTELTGRGGFAAWLTCLILTAAASLAYYMVTDLVWGGYYSVKSVKDISVGWW